MPHGTPVSLEAPVKLQGSLAVGSNTARITTSSLPCSRLWVGAPTANHSAGTNTGRILVGTASGTNNAVGGIPVEADNYAGLFIPCLDASKIYFLGFNAGDCVEYQVFG